MLASIVGIKRAAKKLKFLKNQSMKKQTFFIPLFAAVLLVATQCINKVKAPVQKAVVENPHLITHKEAVDTLMADSTKPIKPLLFKNLGASALTDVCKKHRLDSLFHSEGNWPVNGFYGDDRYRIEFLFTEVKQDEQDPTLFYIKGKNRHKKVISLFEGKMKLIQLRSFTDPNIDVEEVGEMGLNENYAAEGIFELNETDKTSPYSGFFKGTVKMEFSLQDDGVASLWYYSQGLPSGGAGYRFDGNWASFTKPDVLKPVLWAADIFRIGNDILKDFSVGERDVEINEAYRNLGWDNFWENDEWWTETKTKEKM
jgi:hypothetical protein